MSNKNEVFEYLIDQLQQQLPVVDVMGEIKRWSIDRSIAGRGNYTDEENAVIDAYIGLEHNPYKQQCEDLAHEVQSLKNKLRDASAQIKELHKALVKATGDAEAYKLIRKGGYIPAGQSCVVGEHGPEQSGCHKEYTSDEESWIEWEGGECPVPRGELVDVVYRDGKTLYCLPADEIHCTSRDASCIFWRHDGDPSDIVRYRRAAHECCHNWRFVNGKAPAVCINCGVAKSSECEHEWQFYGVGFPCMCIECGLKK